MKLSKLAPICKKGQQIYIMDDTKVNPDTQWAGDGKAFYSLDGMPEFTAGTLFVSLGFDLTEKDCWILSREDLNDEKICVEIDDDSDAEMKFDQFGSITYMGTDFVIGYAAGKRYFFNQKYFSPLKIDGNFSAVLRKTNGAEYLVTKDGMFPTAIIAPIKISEKMEVWLTALGKK